MNCPDCGCGRYAEHSPSCARRERNPSTTPDQASWYDSHVLANDPQLIFHISAADVLSTIVASRGRPHTLEEEQALLNQILENRSALTSAVMEAFQNFAWADHNWTDAVTDALADVLPDLND